MTLIYIDLALLLYKNFISQVDKPQNVVGYDNESGSLVIQPNKQSKVKSIQNIETWTDGFINCVKIFLQRFPNSALELITHYHNLLHFEVCPLDLFNFDKVATASRYTLCSNLFLLNLEKYIRHILNG
jgi:hypothetical protein